MSPKVQIIPRSPYQLNTTFLGLFGEENGMKLELSIFKFPSLLGFVLFVVNCTCEIGRNEIECEKNAIEWKIVVFSYRSEKKWNKVENK